MASESYEHILSHCEHEDNKAYRNLTLATAKEIRESMEKEPKDQAVHGVMVALDKVFHSQFRASPLAWTGMLTQADVELLGDAVLATPLSDQQMTFIAKYVRAYTDGALALMSGYIHSILPPHPSTKNKSDIRHFFPRKKVTAPNPTPTPTADEWQPARHGIKRPVEPTPQSPPVPTNNPFGLFDDDDEEHSEDATPVSAPSTPVSPKRAKVLKRLIRNNQRHSLSAIPLVQESGVKRAGARSESAPPKQPKHTDSGNPAQATKVKASAKRKKTKKTKKPERGFLRRLKLVLPPQAADRAALQHRLFNEGVLPAGPARDPLCDRGPAGIG
jgi:hypothetical protein